VYAQDAPAGTEMGELKMHKGTVDVAKADGRVVDALTTLTGDRLKRGVQSGWPVLLSDFEPVPDVDRQSQVVVHVRYGAVRIKTLGRALDAGDVGDVIPVLVEGAASSVLAKVTGKGVVDIAR
jgi:flagella basal body P-ring formation protein FlgA